MLHALFAEGRVELGRLAALHRRRRRRAARWWRASRRRAWPRASASPPSASTKLARDFAARRRRSAYGRVGVCTQEFGGLAAWLINVLNVVTGNFDRAGGAMFTTPAADLVGLATRLGERGHFGVWKSRVRGLPEFGGELPVAALAEEIETPGEGQIRALVTHAGNPVLSTPNGARLSRALAGLDFMVAIDIYLNETTRHAHLILPTSFGLERDHYDLAFYALAVRNAARYVPPVLTPPPGVRHDWQVLLDLALGLSSRAAAGGKRPRRSVWLMRAIRWLGPRRVLDLLLRFGPHKLSLAKLADEPHGIDLGPLEPRLPAGAGDQGQAHRAGAADVRRRRRAPRSAARRHGRDDVARSSCCSSAAAICAATTRGCTTASAWSKAPRRARSSCTPTTPAPAASPTAIACEVRSRVGAVAVPLALSADIAVGVVSLPHGWGHGGDGVALRVAQSRAGASINDLTDEERLDALSGNASFSGVPVTVSARS